VNKITDTECRFDVITVDLSKNPHNIEHIENALSPF
jgi:Holliday junction resolvase-like predicted endonuclease